MKRMNSKELLAQARETAEKQLKLAEQIEKAESILNEVKTGFICFYVAGHGSTRIDDVVDNEKLDVIKDLALVAIMNYRDDKTKELEKLLGLKLPAAGIDVKPHVVGPAVPMGENIIEEKLTEILQDEAKLIEAPPEDNSIGKYPAKSKKYSGYPDNMTVELVREMYIDKGMKISDISDHFKVTYSKTNNFISKHKMHRVSQAPKPDTKPDKQSDEKESHSQN
jgi:hypothetical protein